MKRRVAFLEVAVLVAMVVATGSCSLFGPNISDGLGLESGEVLFYSSARETTPEIPEAASARSTSGDPSEWTSGSGNPLYVVFNLLREFNPEIHEGVLDRSNLYKVLYDVGNLIPENPVELAAPAAVQSPFDFGSATRTYAYGADQELTFESDYEGISDYAMNVDGTAIEALVTYVWREGEKYERGVFQADYDAATGDIEIQLVHLVTYADGESYSNRVFVSGNETDHTFTIKSLNAGKSATAGEGTANSSIVGTGVSMSDSTDDYFLVKVLAGSLTEPSYYKLPAGATEEELQAYPWDGRALSDIDDPHGYATAVEALEMYTINDAILSVDGFVGGTNDLQF